MMIEIKNKEKCVGCGSCETICPQKCIQMKTDEDGFIYPNIDTQSCIGCNLCDDVCLINNMPEGVQECKLAYAGNSTDVAERTSSSSGGVFGELARSVLEQDGLVYGVAFNGEFLVQHKCVTKVNDLSAIRGSKYLPSKAGIVYNEIKKHVLRGTLVLFSGTPCQVNALYTFMGTRPSNLITIAVACHGIPSLKVWGKYKAYLQEKYNSNLVSYSFRRKKLGWHNYSVEADFENGQIYSSEFLKDPYMKLFVRNISLRPSCYKCHFRGKNTDADIILGDFWSIKNFVPELDDNKGTSLIIIHTENGRKLFETILEKVTLHCVDYNAAMHSNLALVKSPMLTRNRKRFFYHLDNMDFEGAVFKFTTQPLWKRTLIMGANMYINIKKMLKHKK